MVLKNRLVTKIEANDIKDGTLTFPDEAVGIRANIQELEQSERCRVKLIDFNNIEWFQCFEHSINWGDNGGSEYESRISKVFPNIVCFKAPKLNNVHDHLLEAAEFLEEVDISNVQLIAEDAFQHCTSLRNITMPNVKTIKRQAFAYCSNLVDVEGITYKRDNTTSIEYIGLRAFMKTGLKKIHLCGNVTVDSDAFIETDIKNVYIESSNSIGSAFTYCDKIETIYAAGNTNARFWIDDGHAYKLKGKKASDDKKIICSSRTVAVASFRAACSYLQVMEIDNDRDLYVLEEFDRYVLVNRKTLVAVLLNNKKELDDALKIF